MLAKWVGADFIDKYCAGTSRNPGEHAFILNRCISRKDKWRNDINEMLEQRKVFYLGIRTKYSESYSMIILFLL